MSSRKLNESMPRAPLKIIAMDNCRQMGEKVNKRITERRKKRLSEISPDNLNQLTTFGYDSENYLLDYKNPRWGTGEGRVLLDDSVRGTDLFIIADTVNYSQTYDLRGEKKAFSPDDHFMDLKRIIMACSGNPNRITVIMPYLYEGRQNFRTSDNESLDCAQALQELIAMGVENIITFDAHDSRVQNAIPNYGFDNFYTSYQFIWTIFENIRDFHVSSDRLMVISPDVGGMSRAVFYANQLGVDMGMFYKRLDYSQVVDGEHPVTSIEFLGKDIKGMDCIIVDDMIASGRTVLDTARELKKRGASRVFICATFGLFSRGLDIFDMGHADGIFDRIFTTNLCYCPQELLHKDYYTNVDLSPYIALIIDTLNHDTSVNNILDATGRIKKLVEEHSGK